MNVGLGSFLYMLQALVAVGGFISSRSLPGSAKGALLAKLSQAGAGAGEFLVVASQWAGFCFLGILGMIVFAFGLRWKESRQEAARFIGAGACLCVAVIFWPLAM